MAERCSHLCLVLQSGGQMSVELLEYDCIKASVMWGDFPLHQAVFEAYVRMGLADRYCDS